MSPDESWSFGLHVPCHPRAVGVARSTLRGILRAASLSCLADTAELLASELVTNAIRFGAAGHPFLSVDYEPKNLRVAVWDTGPDLLPASPQGGRDDEHGRGWSWSTVVPTTGASPRPGSTTPGSAASPCGSGWASPGDSRR